MRRTRRRVLSISSGCSFLLVAAALPALTAPAAQAATAPTKTPTSISARVYLAARDSAGLDKAVAAVSNPDSPSYGKYLTPAQYRARFGATAAAAAKVTSWLRHAGLTVSAPQQNGRYLAVAGSVVSIERAFGDGLAIFRRAGGSHPGPATGVTVPRNVAPYVLTVTGLDPGPALVKTKVDAGSSAAAPTKQPVTPAAKTPATVAYPAGYRTAQPCSLWYGQLPAATKAGGKVALPAFDGTIPPYTVCGYQPSQLRGAYGAPASLTGNGVTVAVIDAYLSPALLKDANQYATNTGTTPFAAGQFSSLLPAGGFTEQQACDSVGWSTEQSLDIEAVHGFAPGANVLYAAARSCSAADLFDAQAAVVDDNRASIVSLSYGSIESSETATDAALDTALFKQAALQGIGFYVASGDNGDELISTGKQQVDTSGSNPYATAVGGTSLGIGQEGQYTFEAGWGTQRYSLAADGKSWVTPSFAGGAGGGTSALFAEPSYQQGVVVPGAKPGRLVPDVGMLADPNTGMIIGLTQQFPEGARYGQYRLGGTSLASPLFAAAQALASQALKVRLGFANPRIYAIYKKQLAGGIKGVKAFHDVTPAAANVANARADYTNGLNPTGGLEYSIRTFDDDTSLATGKGWDRVTGVGSPAGAFYSASGR
ncbi:MAG: serine protease [Mycobacterium sp.]|nr:serine protease [Mycobacterium sp.]